MRYLLLLPLLLCFACDNAPSPDAPAPPTELGLETAPEEQPVVEPRDITDYNPGNDEQPLDDLIVLDSLPAESVITSPYTVTGRARGYWFFEGNFPVVLTDENGQVLAETYGRSPESWMTEDFIPFTVPLTFEVPEGTRATLKLQRANPAGPEEGKDRAVSVPVVLR